MSTYSSTPVDSPVGTDDQSGRHPVNVGHLVMGVAFLGLATIWALFESDAIDSSDLRWFLPLPWLAAGLAGLLAVALTGRRSRPEPEVTYAADPMWAQPDSYTRDRDAQLDADIESAERDRDES
ncbi:hypothetical protein [Nocardioides currus]|uniref:Uncharacterized protein n=1 Tax=Nocardioides currus TaxID=2133958 RepID=A0A2R7Z0Z9_9ACTN|nr:hypothetical protein [Nocardioides currus]PUA81819.1 hypothetical protein C7S10_07090 [Nocardioides currus]